MPCDEVNATLAWLYGEGDEGQPSHIATCATCLSVVEEHEEVLAAVTRAEWLGAPSARPVAANRPWGRAMGWALVGMAAVALGVVWMPQPDASADVVARGVVLAVVDEGSLAWDVELDGGLEEIAWDVQALSDDGSIL